MLAAIWILILILRTKTMEGIIITSIICATLIALSAIGTFGKRK